MDFFCELTCFYFDSLLDDDKPYIPVSASRSSTGQQQNSLQKGTLETVAHPPPIIASTSSRPLAFNPSQSSLFSANADVDECNESDGNVTDDEYVPSPALGPRKRRRDSCSSSRRRVRVPSEHLSSEHLSSNDDEYRPVKKLRLPPPPRNRQTTSPVAIELAAELPKSNFICPECGWKQMNQRIPDFKRHLRTHTRPSNQDKSKGWWCKGVRLEEAAACGLPKTAEGYLFSGVWRVGGCQRTFARRDALKRHLDNSNVPCIGRTSEGNKN